VQFNIKRVVMRISKFYLLLVLLSVVSFFACEERNNQDDYEKMFDVESIYFSQDSDVWKAKAENLGSCYAVVDNKTNPSWCDVVVCTEDLKDFDVDLYGKYLFLHFDLDENKNPKNVRAEFYKNKSAQNAGEFDLMLVSKQLQVYIKDLNEETITGRVYGTMQNITNTSDVRDVVFYFKDIDLKTSNELK
jgi:hypothetical protein